MGSAARVFRVEEWETFFCPRAELSEDDARQMARLGQGRLTLVAPSIFNDQRWALRSEGWVGYLPVGPDLAVALQPKTRVANLFRMLEYAYGLDLDLSEGNMACESLREFYERLANILALKVLARARRGLYAAYVPHEETAAFVRGRIDLAERLRRPWAVGVPCRFEEHTRDVEENQLLAWTLDRVARSGLCSNRVLPTVRRAVHALHGYVTVRPFDASACVARLYNRLNEDYASLHGLCRFFLEHTGPTQNIGDHRMVPFLMDMARLFEAFVAAWLNRHLPARLRMDEQRTVQVDTEGRFSFRVDLVLLDAASGRPLMALDTKYKIPDKPGPDDIYQAVTYAESLGCHEAVLVYPRDLRVGLDQMYGRDRVRSVAFDISTEDLEASGRALLARLGVWSARRDDAEPADLSVKR